MPAIKKIQQQQQQQQDAQIQEEEKETHGHTKQEAYPSTSNICQRVSNVELMNLCLFTSDWDDLAFSSCNGGTEPDEQGPLYTSTEFDLTDQ